MKIERSSVPIGLVALTGLLAVVLFVLFLPVWQTVLYGLFIQTPALWYWLGVGGVIAVLAARLGHNGTAVGILTVAVVLALLVGPFLSGVYAQEDIVTQQRFDEVSVLPNTSDEHVRVLPRHVADTYADSSMQFPVYQLTRSDITYHDGHYTWSQGLAPDRITVALLGSQHGAFFTNMETQEKDVDIVENDISCGMGQLFTDSYAYRMNVKRFDVNHKPATAFNLQHNGELHIAQSYVSHEWRFGNPLDGRLPMPYVVPRYGGTLTIDGDCSVRDIPAADVPESNLLDNQSTYPYDLARFRVSSMQLSHGLLNAVFVGEDVPQIASTPGQGNSQPFTVPMAGGDLSYFVAMEPSGSGTGIYQVYVLDAQTGDIQFVEYNETQTGPQRAADFVRRENPRVNWAQGESGTMTVSEPIPVVKDGVLFWHVRVVPTDGAGIAYTAFVNAKTSEVTEVSGDKEIYAFVRDGEVDNINSPTSPDKPTIQIAIIEDGTVVRMVNVSANATIRITQDDDD